MACTFSSVPTMQTSDWVAIHDAHLREADLVRYERHEIPAPGYTVIVLKCPCGASHGYHKPHRAEGK